MKRIISLLFIVVMVLGYAPLAIAAQADSNGDYPHEVQDKVRLTTGNHKARGCSTNINMLKLL